MPALLAYIVAVALLVGGGFEALHWLTIPEPSKVVARGISRQSAPLPKKAEIAETKTHSQIAADEKTEGAPPEAQQVPLAAVNTGPNDLGNDAKEALQHSPPTDAAPSEKPRIDSSEAPAIAQRRAMHRSLRAVVAQHRYVLMTLRTFEFSDGRRMQRLIPFRGAGRSVAYLPEQ